MARYNRHAYAAIEAAARSVGLRPREDRLLIVIRDTWVGKAEVQVRPNTRYYYQREALRRIADALGPDYVGTVETGGTPSHPRPYLFVTWRDWAIDPEAEVPLAIAITREARI